MTFIEAGFSYGRGAEGYRLLCQQCKVEGSFEWQAHVEILWQAVVNHRKQCNLVICSWCDAERGDSAIKAGIDVSHTICPACLPKVVSQIQSIYGSTAIAQVEVK
jgi:hypothetical protein